MDSCTVQQKYYSLQCMHAARELVDLTIAIKSDGQLKDKDLLSNPRVQLLVKRLDTWTNELIIWNSNLPCASHSTDGGY